jgi:hypothetical protein
MQILRESCAIRLLSQGLGDNMFLVCATSDSGRHELAGRSRRRVRTFFRRIGGFFVVFPVFGCVLCGKPSIHHWSHGLSGLVGGYVGNLPALRVTVNTP